jgi:p-cumate 2,3-dioxygenase beta subunit
LRADVKDMRDSTLNATIEHFLVEEAELLDAWRLPEWLELFAEDGRYLVPPVGQRHLADASPDTTLFLVSDDHTMLTARVTRLMKKTAYVENPRSLLRRLVSNVRVTSNDGERLNVAANFCVYRTRRAEMTIYPGQYRYRLSRAGREFRIHEKRACLDVDRLQPQGSLGIIL